MSTLLTASFPSTSWTAASSSKRLNNLSAEANVCKRLFERLLKATTGPKDDASINIQSIY